MPNRLRYTITGIGGFCLGYSITNILTGQLKNAAFALMVSTVAYAFGNYYEQYLNMKN